MLFGMYIVIYLIINNDRYKQISLQFYTILMGYADDLQAVSVDEALIEVTSNVVRLQASSGTQDAAKDLAEIIRADVLKKTGCQGLYYLIYIDN